jgi:hypothetical protein
MREIIIKKKKVGYDGRYYLIIPDHAAGRSNVYTVYKIPSSPSREVEIIGRELDLKLAKEIARKEN